MKKSFKGFTLIELLVVISIIGLLSTIIAAPIQSARKKAKDAKKLSELNSVKLALEQYAEANGNQYPPTLQAIYPNFMPILPSFARVAGSDGAAPNRDLFAYVTYSHAVGGIFAYHIGVKLDVYADALKNDRDCNDAVAGIDFGATYNYCVFYNTAANGDITIAYPGWVSGMIGTSVALDLNIIGNVPNHTAPATLADGATSTCQTVDDCVFDTVGSQ